MSPPKKDRALSFRDARALVEQHARAIPPPHRTESVALLAALGRVLAEEIRADRDLPPFPRAARDGYAVRAADVAAAGENSPATLELVGEIAAGAARLPRVGAGHAAAIMTGAPAPAGADAIVMVEYSKNSASGGKFVELYKSAQAGENIVPRGIEARAGQVLLAPGARFGPSAVGSAASVGTARVKVFRKPRVAVLATGDELVEIKKKPDAHQIRNSNSYSLAVQIAGTGADPVILPIGPDEPRRLRLLIAKGLKADLLLLSGGVSAGKYDFVEQVLEEFRAEFIFRAVMIQPGRPVVFGRIPKPRPHRDSGWTYFFGLPGNPVSTLTTFDLFVKPMIDALAGARVRELHFLRARLKSEVKTKIGLTRFLPGLLSGTADETEVEPVKWQGSGDLVSSAKANCYVVIPPDRDKFAASEIIDVLLM